jgi:hypothetical protein
MPDRAFSELSKKEKLAKVDAAQRKAEGVLTGPNKSSVKSERAGAERAKAAAGRVRTSLTGPAPSSKDTMKPGKKSSKGWWDILKGFGGLVSQEKKKLKGIEKGMPKSGK